MTFKISILLTLIFATFNSFSQNSIQFGQRFKVGNQKYSFNNYVDKEVSQLSIYDVDINLVYPATETVLKISSLNIKDTSKFKLGYSLDLGYMFSKEVLKMKMVYFEGDTSYHPASTEMIKHIRSVSITNNLDFHFRLSEKLIFTNSIGASVSGWFVEKYAGKALFVNIKNEVGAVVKLSYSPQLIVSYEKFSLNFHLIQDVFSVNKLFSSATDFFTFRPNSYFSTYSGVGLYFIPYIKKKKIIDNNIPIEN
jgi:hypothetical protein